MGQEPTFSMSAELNELREILEAEWPSRRAALRMSGVALMEGPDDPKDPPKDEPKDKPKDEPKPPWGEDKDFDPQRAWKLLQDVRGDLDKAKTERDTLRTKVQEHDDSSKSDHQKLEERATAAEQQATKATLEAARLRVALKKGLTETQAKRLVGDSEEDLENDADDLLASFKPDDDGQDPPRRPRERLRPGAAPSSEPEETNPVKLAALVPRMY